MKDDLISRAAALDVINTWGRQKNEKVRIGLLHRDLDAIPAVDAAPVVHARWTTKRTWGHDGEWYCSACEYEPVVFMDSNYCPNCGAKMDGLMS